MATETQTKRLEDMTYIQLQQRIRREQKTHSDGRCIATIASGEQCMRRQAYAGDIGLGQCAQHYRKARR